MVIRLSYLAISAAAAATAAAAAAIVLQQSPPRAAPGAAGCPAQDVGITLPPGFCATIFADDLGPVRHMVVTADGTVYANRRYSGNNRAEAPADGLVLALRDGDRDGRAETIERFGSGATKDYSGGIGMALYKGSLYVESGDRIVRYALAPGRMRPVGEPTTILSGLVAEGGHTMHPFAIDSRGGLFVNSGSLTNACEQQLRQPHSPGHDPCTELATRAGIWRYDANRSGQRFSPAERFATGIRNAGAITFDAAGRMFATQHGRDQLSQFWPERFTVQQGADLPAEELLAPVKGADFGWPYCYYDQFQNRRVLAPEYGGDGKAVGRCAGKAPPVAAFPGHWAPNDVLIYRGKAFPSAYRGGAFIAFHGSWNRAPLPQGGYNIVFQPLANGRASGRYIIFADGFAGAVKEPGRARFRPAGLATGPDGALYISENQRGRIWRVTYRGPANAALVAAPAPAPVATAPAGDPPAPGPALPLPPGITAAQVALGKRIYDGDERGGTCIGCHGSDGRGTPVGPGVIGPRWLWGDGSLPSLVRIINDGVATPKQFPTGMPPKGGAPLSDADVQAVAAYVWSLGQRPR